MRGDKFLYFRPTNIVCYIVSRNDPVVYVLVSSVCLTFLKKFLNLPIV